MGSIEHSESNDDQWPPEYQVKKHARAKYVKLRFSAAKGLQITVPPRFSLRHMPDILEKNKPWILKQINKTPVPKAEELPKNITLTALNLTWQIDYIASTGALSLIERPMQELVIMGKINNSLACKKLLFLWIKEKATVFLQQELTKLSLRTQLSYTQCKVRNQESRWGSCSSDKSIQLNCKLLFMPLPLLQHVIIHELCHTKHLNHSARFWQLVATHDVNYLAHKKALRQADRYIPAWLIQMP